MARLHALLAALGVAACAGSPPPPDQVIVTTPPLRAAEPRITAAQPPTAAPEPRAVPSPPSDPARAQEAFDRAKRAFAEHDYATACPLFAESLQFERATGTLLNLAVCEEAQGDRASAIRHFEEAHEASVRDGRPERAAFAKERLDRLRGP